MGTNPQLPKVPRPRTGARFGPAKSSSSARSVLRIFAAALPRLPLSWGSALFGETVAAPYVGGTYSAPSDLFLRSMSMDRLVAMEAFVLVVDTGSFSAAARRLHVGQPAVSKLVAQLEEKLGVKLLVRTTRGLTATEAGLHYYERARRSIQEADEAELVARGAGRSLTGRLRIAAAVTFARIHVMPHLPEFLQQHPDLEIEVVLDDRNVDLVREGIDVALRMGRLADSTVAAKRVTSGRHVVVGTPAYFAKAGELTEPSGLTAHEAVIYDQ